VGSEFFKIAIGLFFNGYAHQQKTCTITAEEQVIPVKVKIFKKRSRFLSVCSIVL